LGAKRPALRPCLTMSSTSSTVRVRTYVATCSHRFAVPWQPHRTTQGYILDSEVPEQRGTHWHNVSDAPQCGLHHCRVP
jgi:hypothetical protein